MQHNRNWTDLALALVLGVQFSILVFNYLFRFVISRMQHFEAWPEYLVFFLYVISSIGTIVIALTIKDKSLRIFALVVASLMFIIHVAGNLTWLLSMP